MNLTLDRWYRQGRHFRHRGHEVFYASGGGGNGPTLLCIHGFPTASWDWARIWPQLCARFSRVLAPDMIGFGYSAKPHRYAYSMFDQADLHESLLAELGISDVHILAHDIGDTVTQELLARYNERGDSGLRLHSATLLNGGLFPETHRATLSQKLLLGPLGPLASLSLNRQRFAKSFSIVFGAGTQPTSDELREFWQLIERNGGARIMHRLIRYILERRAQRERWVGALQRTRVPLFLINGADDPVSGAHMAARYRELVPHPDVCSLPGIGHYPQVESPQAVLDAFLGFHARLPNAGVSFGSAR
jgi:pimeloyl-ACP methyl ester carboxylesterase